MPVIHYVSSMLHIHGWSAVRIIYVTYLSAICADTVSYGGVFMYVYVNY